MLSVSKPDCNEAEVQQAGSADLVQVQTSTTSA